MDEIVKLGLGFALGMGLRDIVILGITAVNVKRAKAKFATEQAARQAQLQQWLTENYVDEEEARGEQVVPGASS